ncbi:lysophospholipid acyltransferase 7 [Belonocnema kinseyi]|uniref:lysophospholipid acyltransferase 7 n=1 Tax=Belonocnema kinseyi TaxID=2817044 RepID=UPI00143D41C9|nr:lysophospholipid acyltransferase 7 [Belonocnema kinseyi]
MLLEDIVYVLILLLSTWFGQYYRKIKEPFLKQWASTLYGLFVVTAVSGTHVFHPIVCTLINSVILTKLPPKQCHIAGIFFSFFYLLVVVRIPWLFGLEEASGHTSCIMMLLTLRLSGLGFEINSAATAPEDDPQSLKSEALKTITFTDVFHYGFSYMGVISGPHYRYRTYWDHLHRPFSDYDPHIDITLYKLKQITCFALIFLVTSNLFPADYILTEDFLNRSFLYKFCYIYPTFITFRMRMFIGMILSECVCQMAGLGAYPARSEPITGLGPKNYKLAETLANDVEQLKKEEINFEAIHNMYVEKVETCITVREAMKVWNTTVQYWMAHCVYKRFPFKPLRTAVVFLLSAIWHGYSPGYFLCIGQIVFFLPMEDIYVKIYKQLEENSLTKTLLGAFLWFMKMSCMAYLGLSFQLLELHETMTYYKSIYFAGHILVALLYLTGQIIAPKIFIKKSI